MTANDRGVQYASAVYRQRLADAQSMQNSSLAYRSPAQFEAEFQKVS